MKNNLDLALQEKRNLTEAESYCLLSEYSIAVPKYKVLFSLEESIEEAKVLGYPVVMKILSPDILHKTEVGGVILNINNEQEMRESYENIMTKVKESKSNVNIQGVLLSKQLPKGIEVIVGMTRNPQFGPTVMFGLGGIFTEVLRDVSFRICPVTRVDVEEMVNEIKGIKVLKGFRNQTGCDLEAIINIIMNVSEIATKYQNIREIDLNPIIVYGKGAIAADAKIILALMVNHSVKF